jgi:hypothetical protein
MTDTNVATTMTAKTKKATAGAKKATPNSDHPKYSEMIKQALATLKERGGSSRHAVLKYIMANFNVGKDENVINSHLKVALRAGVKNSSFKQSKGTGATGSFKLGTEAKNPATKKSGKKVEGKKSAAAVVLKKTTPIKKAKKVGKTAAPKSPTKVVKRQVPAKMAKLNAPSATIVKQAKKEKSVAKKNVKPTSSTKKSAKKSAKPTSTKKAATTKKA